MVHFNWFQLIPFVGHHYVHIASAGLVALGLIVASMLASKRINEKDLSPQGRFGLLGMFEAVADFIFDKANAIIGKDGYKYTSFFCFLFLFVLFNNVLGLIPGFTTASDNINTTLAIGLVAFVFYNREGLKNQGVLNYLKHFLGPVWWFAPLLFVVEIISHMFRPFTLGLRLMGNMKGDHTVLGAFLDLVPVGIPVIFYGLGLFVSVVQALVFTLLSMVYVSMAVADSH